MGLLPESLFADPVRHALRTQHRHLAMRSGAASRYPADVAPFAAIDSPEAREDLSLMLAPGEAVWLMGVPALPGEETLDCFQMSWPEHAPLPDAAADIEPIPDCRAGEMVELTSLAFPGFFRPRTCAMGSYFGVRSNEGELIAMAGERMRLDGFSELSAVCTHPAHRGKGLASALMVYLLRRHTEEKVVSFLHVTCANTRAIALYRALGFETERTVTLVHYRQ